jgi:hypothetical protein
MQRDTYAAPQKGDRFNSGRWQINAGNLPFTIRLRLVMAGPWETESGAGLRSLMLLL